MKATTMTTTTVAKTTPLTLPEPAPTGSYAAAFAQLTSVAEKLRTAASPSVDNLVEDLQRARQAYGVCRNRLAAVRAEIEAEIAVVEADA